MFLGIEIGGTKLQLGVGSGDGRPLVAIQRLTVQPEQGAEGIRGQIERVAGPLVDRHGVKAVGVGFGGPVDVARGRTIRSHQVDGWNDFPLADWCRQALGLPAVVANDSDSAGLAEARFGAGQGHRIVFYTNVGSGIGGALVIEGQLYRGGSGVAAELGHLRPGLQFERADQTIESISSGWGIAAAARARLSDAAAQPSEASRQSDRPPRPDALDLLRRSEGQIEQLTAELIARAALEGNRLARQVFDHACRVYGWGIAQMATLLAPNVVVIGGGVSLVGDELWIVPLREHVRRYVFGPLSGTFEIVPATLGEDVVVHGVLALAAAAKRSEAPHHANPSSR